MRYISVDIECTGLDPLTCDIIEFGAVLEDSDKSVPVLDLPTFHCYLVKDSYVGEPYALSMHPTIFRRIAERHLEENRSKYSYLNASSLGNAFKKFLANNGYTIERDKALITAAGKNFSSFDLQFLKHKSDFLKHIDVRSGVLDPGILYLEGDE